MNKHEIEEGPVCKLILTTIKHLKVVGFVKIINVLWMFYLGSSDVVITVMSFFKYQSISSRLISSPWER